MKYFITLLLSTALLSFNANAAQGRAAIPNFVIDSSGFWTYIYLSNITDKDIEVEVDLYNMDGTMMQDNNSATSGNVRLGPQALINNYTENGGNTASFTIGAHQTVSFQLAPGTYNQGHGFIRWKQEGTRRKAMLAHGRVYRGQSSREFAWSISINGGKTF